MTILSPNDEINKFFYGSASNMQSAFSDMAHALVKKASSFQAKQNKLAQSLKDTLQMSAMLGARRMILEARQRQFGTDISPDVPPVKFEEAIQSLLSRYPQLAGTYSEVSRKYSSEYAFSLARSSSMLLTQRTQKAIADLFDQGATEATAGQVLDQIGNWGESYSRMVYRTNMASAYTEGRFQQARSPEMQGFVAGFEYDATRDSDVRPNHWAMNGVKAGVNDPIWKKYASPLGYNCRCNMSIVDIFQAEDEGLLMKNGQFRPARIPQGAGPDKGFVK